MADGKPIWDIWMSQHNLPAVTVSLEIGLFELLSKGPATYADMVKSLGITRRAAEAIVAVLCGLGLVENSSPATVTGDAAQAAFRNTSLANAHLLKESPTFFGHMLKGDSTREPHRRLLEIAKSDKPIGAVEEWEQGELTHERAKGITASMQAHSIALAAPAAEALMSCPPGVRRMLDVAGGSGCFLITLAQRVSSLTGTILELPAVCRVIESDYLPKGLAERINTASVDMFRSDWPTGYDTHFMSNILHDWTDEQSSDLIARSFKALPSKGRLVLHEMLLTEARDGPLTTAAFSMHMLIYTKGRQYTFSDLRGLLQGVGFGKVISVKAGGYYSLVIAEKP